MAYEFTKLSEVELLESVPDNASAFVEVAGTVKRVPGSGLGGGGIKTVVIKEPNYDSAVSDVQTNATSIVAGEATAPTVNMTFEEAYGIMASGEPLMSLLMLAKNAPPAIVCGVTAFVGDKEFGEPCIMFLFRENDAGINTTLFWTSSGLSSKVPSGGGGLIES